MAGLPLSEDEQSERIKAWWRENGTSIIVGAVLGIAVIGGVNYWRSYTADQAESASALYEQLLDNGEGAADAGRRLLEDYAATPYAGKAALMLAGRAFESGNVDEARGHLEWALNDAPDAADRRVARLRLARIALSAERLDEVDSLLSGMSGGGYESEYRELLGDLAMARNDPATARTEYEAALKALPEQSGFADMLNRKLDAAIGASQ